jgi:adenylyltransferase/sulfurtransferase
MNRYDRQISLEEVGILGQKNLAKAKVLCIGAGGLGSPILYYLASAGVGTIGIVDGDQVDLTNLQRQILFNEVDQGSQKAQVAKGRLEKLNSKIHIIAINEFLTEINAELLFKNYDLIIDGTDNFKTKFLINKTAKKMNKTWIYGSATGFEGQIALFEPQGSCLQCLLQKAPQQNQFSCAEAGVLGAMVGWIGSIQALEAIRYLINRESSQFLKSQANQNKTQLNSQLLYIDGLNYNQRKFEILQAKSCPVCASIQDKPVEKVITDLAKSPSIREFNSIHYNLEDYFVIDLSDTSSHFKADFKYSISDLFTQDQIPKTWIESEKPLLFFCESGYKSQSAVSYMNSLGYKNVTHLPGGIQSGNLSEITLTTP